jgi:hypothetical protein
VTAPVTMSAGPMRDPIHDRWHPLLHFGRRHPRPGGPTVLRWWIVLDWVRLSDLGSRRSSYRRHLDNREDP